MEARGRGRGGRRGGGRAAAPAAAAAAKPIADPATARFFGQCQETLDAFHDTRERIIKASRDITIASKRLIFLVHRSISEPIDTIIAEARESLKAIISQLHAVFSAEIKDMSLYFKHRRSIAPGLEEFIEAISFLHYIEHNSLITFAELTDILKNQDGETIVHLIEEDYILGIADLTGELMRYCITLISSGHDNHDRADSICQFMRSLLRDYEVLDYPPARKKMGAMRASVSKVEAACFMIAVRGSEFPRGMLLDRVEETQSQTSAEFFE